MILLQIDSVKVPVTSWLQELTDYTAPVNNLAAIIIAVCGGLLWRYYKRKEVEYKIVELRAQTFLDSNKAIWGLLKYLSSKVKADTVFQWNSETKEWSFNPVNAQRFSTELNKVYYTDGNGIMLEKEIRDKIFEIENKILKCYRESAEKESTVTMKRPGICNEIMQLKRELIDGLRKIVLKNNLLEHGKI